MPNYDLTTMNAILKEDYAPELVELYRQENVLYNLLNDQTKVESGGRYFYIPVETRPGSSAVAGADGGMYPIGNAPEISKFQFPYTTYRESKQFTGDLSSDSKNSQLAFLSAAEKAMKDGMKGIMGSIGRDIYGHRRNPLCLVTSASNAASSVLTIKDDNTGASISHNKGTRFLPEYKNSYVQIIDPATGLPRAGAGGETEFLLTAITNTTSCTVGANVSATVADGDFLVPVGHYGNALMGLDDIISDGTDIPSALFADYGGMNRSTAGLSSVVKNLAGADLTEEDLTDCVNATRIATGADFDPSNFLMIMSWELYAAIQRWHLAEIRYAPEQANMGVDDKFTSMNFGFGQVKLYKDLKCPARSLFGVNLDYLRIHENDPIRMVDVNGQDTGNVIQLARDPATNRVKDAYEMFFRARLQLASSNPRAHFKIFGAGSVSPEFGVGGSPSTFVVPR